ncbi:MAG: tail fiber domain-containing protein, partial [Flavobacteriales bacterium]
MRTRRLQLLSFCAICSLGWAYAQNDGDHLITNAGGQTSLATDVQVPAPPVNLTVGTTPGLDATLRVRGDELAVSSGFNTGLCTFRTDVAAGVEQGWEMWRDINQIGRIWHYGLNGPLPGGHRALHIQSMEQRDDGQDRYSGVFIMNNDDDGFWLSHNGPPTGGRAFPDPALQLLDCNGYAALGSRPNYMNTGPTRPRGPWSRWHLFHNVNGTRPWFAHRSQMRNGMTLTGNSDHAYIGQWFDQGENGIEAEVDDHSNLVIATSEDAIPEGFAHYWDNISFRFFSDLSGADGAASSVNGLETMRIQPHRPGAGARVEGLVGIGDFLSAGLSPEERLDLLDGTLRIRSMGSPGLYNNDNLDRVLVVDPVNGRVHWRNASTLGGGGGLSCTSTPVWWTFTGATALNVSTAYTGNPGCNGDQHSVTIGTNPSVAGGKLVVQGNANTNNAVLVSTGGGGGNQAGLNTTAAPFGGNSPATNYRGVLSVARNATGANAGVESGAYVDAGFTTAQNQGLRTLAQVNASGTATSNFGHLLEAVSLGTTAGNVGISARIMGTCQNAFGVTVRVDGGTNLNFGVNASATGGAGNGTNESYGGRFFGTNSTRAYGVYAEASGGSLNNYGVFARAPLGATNFAGYFAGDVFTTGAYLPSDEQLKTNVQPLTGSMDRVMGMQPVSFDYLSEDAVGMALPVGTQIGLIAGQLQAIRPDLVRDAVHPPMFTEDGEQLTEAVQFKAIRMDGIIPDLIGCVQALKVQCDALQEQLAACCAADGRSAEPGGQVGHGAAIAADDLRTERLQIIPNPVAPSTTLRYYVPRAGRVRLELSAEDGRALEN